MVGSVTKRGVCSALGFGMSKAATSVGYLTAMGSVVHNIGFVTELWFMLASETASIVLACVIVAWAAKAPLSETVPQWPAWVTFAAGFVLSASGVLANAPAAVGAAGQREDPRRRTAIRQKPTFRDPRTKNKKICKS